MRVLFADTSEPSTLTALEARGHECVLRPDVTADGLPAEVPGVDVLVVRSTRVTAEAITAADRLALVIRAGAGTNTIDCDAAAERGVFVANVPGRNSIAVAELTMGLLLAIDRRIADNVADLRAGRWDKKQYGKADGLYGSTMAIVGLGEIGLTVADRARAFGLDVRALAKDGRDRQRAARADDLGLTMVESLQELVEGADVVSLHVPAGPDTTGLVDRTFLSWMRPGTILLNTSRGDVVDEEALLEALDGQGLRAGLDVYTDEPSSGTAQWTSRLARHPQVVGTHHIGASTRQAQRAIAEGVVEIVDAFVEGRTLNCVNLTAQRIGAATISVRHLDKVGVLAGVLDVLSQAHLNVEDMSNRIFSGGHAAVATIDVAGRVDEDLVRRLRELPEVLGVAVAELRRSP